MSRWSLRTTIILADIEGYILFFHLPREVKASIFFFVRHPLVLKFFRYIYATFDG